ncbi:MAG: hypothetical protein IJ081_00160 [Prevotella sp.]|nr:hypothetical protein [Prevotella sp.]
MAKTKEELREARKQWFVQMEQKLQEMHTKEDDSLFYYHSSEDRIVLSHAMFWTMTQLQFFKSKMRKEKFFLLLRQYEEEMLDAFLQDDDYFSELLHYCNIRNCSVNPVIATWKSRASLTPEGKRRCPLRAKIH